MLQFGQVEIGAAALFQQRTDVVEKVQAKIHQTGAGRVVVDEQMLFNQVPPAWPYHECSRLFCQHVYFAIFCIGIADGTVNGISEVDLPLYDIIPVRGITVFKISHKYLSAGIQCVNDHFTIYRSGYLYPSVLQVGRGWVNAPFACSYGGCFWQEMGRPSLIDPELELFTIDKGWEIGRAHG